MAVSSMTGFGRSEGHQRTYAWVVEVKSVNGRGLDIRLNLPSQADQLDEYIRGQLKTNLKRGNIQFALSLIGDGSGSEIRVNDRELMRLARRSRIWARNRGAAPATFDGLLGLRGIISSDQSSRSSELPEDVIAPLRASIDEALAALVGARQREGQGLEAVLLSILDDMVVICTDAKGLAEATPGGLQAKLEERLKNLLDDSELDDVRIAQEVAILASKADVREELDRLGAHIGDARGMIARGGAIGRKLDFLAQEMHREANTLGSKASSLELSRCSLALKALIDQFKEQAANVE